MTRKTFLRIVMPWTIVAASAVTMGSPILAVALIWCGVAIGLMFAVK